MKMFQKGFIKRSAKESKAMSKEYWQQEYHWHKQVESEVSNTEKCGTPWCDVYDMTPWKAQCSFEGTGRCGAQAAEVLDKIMDKTKIAKMDMAAFREMKELEAELEQLRKDHDRWRNLAQAFLDANPSSIQRINSLEAQCESFKLLATRWRNLAGVMHQSIVDGDPDTALLAYEELSISQDEAEINE